LAPRPSLLPTPSPYTTLFRSAQLATLTEQPLQVQKDPLHALLVEVAVLTEGNQVPQQAGPVDRRATVTDHYAGPVRLPGDRAVGFEQVAVEGLAHLARPRQQPQEAGIIFVTADPHIHVIQTLSRQSGNAQLLDPMGVLHTHQYRRLG